MSTTVFSKPLSDELTKKADINSPALTGTPTAPTAAAGTNTTQIATTAFVQSKLDKPAQAGTQDQILRSDGNGGIVWTNAATQTEIGTAVTNWLDTNVPTGTTVVIDNSLSVQNAAADSKTTGDAIALETANRTAADNDLKSALYYETLLLNAGEYTVDKDFFEQGQWSYGNKSTLNFDYRIRSRTLLPVKKWTALYYKNTDQELYFGIVKDVGASSYLQSSGWLSPLETPAVRSFVCNFDGYLNIMSRIDNSSTTITPNDFNSEIVIMSSEVFNAPVITKSGMKLVHGYADSSTGLFVQSPSVYRTDKLQFDNKLLYLKTNDNYNFSVVKYENDTVSLHRYNVKNTYLYAYKNAKYVIYVSRTDSGVIFPSDIDNIDIIEYENESEDLGHGLKKISVDFSYNTYFSEVNLSYATLANRCVSQMIKLPTSGIRIIYNPAYKRESVPMYRIVCVKKTDSGLQYATSDENILAESRNLSYQMESVYIPYVEDAYIIIISRRRENDPPTFDGFDDFLWVYGGNIEDNGGKLPGLIPVRCFTASYGLRIQWWNQLNSVINSSRYYGGCLNMRHASKIYCDPKYTIIANIYELDPTETNGIALRDSIWSYETGTDAGRIYGVNYIDLTKYNFKNGIVLFAVHNNTFFKKTGEESATVRQMSMGVMNKYQDVFNSVYVEYKNGYEWSLKQGINRTVFNNAYYFENYTFPARYPSYYVNPRDNVRHYFDEMFDCSPAFYAGSYDANTVLLQITGKSYYTAMQNQNSRCYQFAAKEGAYGSIGYGITCTDFTSILHGLDENYGTTALAYSDNYKFDRIADDWDYKTQMNLLQPGDWLIESKEVPGGDYECWEAHCMVVSSITSVNGVVEYINIIEAGYPYTRYTCLYSEYFEPLMATWGTFKRLADYPHIRRIKAEYIRDIRESYDLSTGYTVGTLMCDRGTDSIYCLTNNHRMEHMEVSCSDSEASKIYIYRNGSLITQNGVPISSTKKNGMRVTDIAPYISESGYYTLKTSTTGNVQESFYIPPLLTGGVITEQDWNPETQYDVIDNGDGTRTVYIPNFNDLLHVSVIYDYTIHDNTEYPELNGLTYPNYIEFLKEQCTQTEGQNCGTVKIQFVHPETGATYNYVRLVYRTPPDTGKTSSKYGVYHLQYDGMTSEGAPGRFIGKYSTKATYSVGDKVMHNGDLKQCAIAWQTPGAWNDAYWEDPPIPT